eukprot:3944678-Alexandrium_andersonii.AAC.1
MCIRDSSSHARPTAGEAQPLQSFGTQGFPPAPRRPDTVNAAEELGARAWRSRFRRNRYVDVL